MSPRLRALLSLFYGGPRNPLHFDWLADRKRTVSKRQERAEEAVTAAEAAERVVCREERQKRPLTLVEIAVVGALGPLACLRYVASARK